MRRRKGLWLTLLFALIAAAACGWRPASTVRPPPLIQAAWDWASLQARQALRADQPARASPSRSAAEPENPQAGATSRRTAVDGKAEKSDKRRARMPLFQRCADDELRIAAMRRAVGEAPESGTPWLQRIEASFRRRCAGLKPDADLLHEARLRAKSRIHLLEEDARLRVQAEQETTKPPLAETRSTRP